ncbi:MAG: dTDP-4-dehydrorhamnose 3,5-epimerase [Chloroflexota bacterium]|nr:dTDP-4-dehydrorhamnose 3,5-epimerase [Chloroflexota bacterium]
MDIYIIPTKLEGVVIVETDYARDERGFFLESYHHRNYAVHGIGDRFVQDNHSRSSINVLRGLHYQDVTAPQAKMVRCIIGAIWDVAVDLRAGSPTFGQWVGVELTAENMRQLFIPVGFAHGFVARTEPTEILYKCTNYYTPSAEGAIAWDDPDLGITWPVDEPILSQRDCRAKSLRSYRVNPAFHYLPEIQATERTAASPIMPLQRTRH